MDYRRNITKSKSGHYHLTLICKTTGIRVTGDFGWGLPERAKEEEEGKLIERLAEARARRASLQGDFNKICDAVAALPADEVFAAALGRCGK